MDFNLVDNKCSYLFWLLDMIRRDEWKHIVLSFQPFLDSFFSAIYCHKVKHEWAQLLENFRKFLASGIWWAHKYCLLRQTCLSCYACLWVKERHQKRDFAARHGRVVKQHFIDFGLSENWDCLLLQHWRINVLFERWHSLLNLREDFGFQQELLHGGLLVQRDGRQHI